MNPIIRLTSSNAPRDTVLIRLMVGSVFLLIVGAGAWSLDAMLAKRAVRHRYAESPPREETP